VAFCAQADVERAAGGAAHLVELTDLAGTGAVNAEVLADAIARADADILLYVNLQADIPTVSVPESIRSLSAQGAVYELRKARGALGTVDATAREEWLTKLRDLGSGRARISEPMPTASSAASRAGVYNRDSEPFSRAALNRSW
jgi:phage gp36-like protein